MPGLLPYRRLAGALCLGLMCAGTPAHARLFDGVTMPDQIVVDGQTLHLNGMGVRTFTILRVHGYVAGLYVPQAGRNSQAILAAPGIKLLRVQYVHAASLSQVQAEMRRGRALDCGGGCPPSDDPAFAQLFATAHAVRPGDVNIYIYAPGGMRVLFNDIAVATIANPDFGQRMLGGMLGEHPPTTVLRDGLLGLDAG